MKRLVQSLSVVLGGAILFIGAFSGLTDVAFALGRGTGVFTNITVGGDINLWGAINSGGTPMELIPDHSIYVDDTTFETYTAANTRVYAKARRLKTDRITFPNTSTVQMTFSVEAYDVPGGMIDLGADDTIITFIESGFYVVYAELAYLTNPTGERTMYLRRNGLSGPLKQVCVGACSSDHTIVEGAFFYNFTTNETLQLYGKQSSGGPLDCYGTLTVSRQ